MCANDEESTHRSGLKVRTTATSQILINPEIFNLWTNTANRKIVFIMIPCYTTASTKTLVQAFISNRLDHCNSLLYGITDNLFRCVQAVQNAAARLITGVRRHEHITPVLKQLHWLPVRQRVHFKLAVTVFRALHGTAPSYLAEDCQLVASTDCRQLRSSTVNTCLVTRTSTCLGDRSFAAAGPRLWNSLPTYLRQPDLSLGQFRRALKTHLFLAAWLRRLVTICFLAPLYKYPYLLTYLPHRRFSRTRRNDWPDNRINPLHFGVINLDMNPKHLVESTKVQGYTWC